jgi:hypothetical protein
VRPILIAEEFMAEIENNALQTETVQLIEPATVSVVLSPEKSLYVLHELTFVCGVSTLKRQTSLFRATASVVPKSVCELEYAGSHRPMAYSPA